MMLKRLFYSILLLLFFSCQSQLDVAPDEGPLFSGIDIEMASSSDYMAVFGDIQYLTTNKFINIYQHSINWLLQQTINGKRVISILHTGDICHDPNSISHWRFFQTAMARVSRVIPYYSMIGDHDYTWYDGVHINGRRDTHFNEYIQFPLALHNVLAQFEPGRMENVVIKNAVQGQRLDLLILEFGPRKEVVDWANAYVKEHPSEKFILMTHEYLESGGGRRTKGLKSVSRLQNTTYTTPEQLWECLIKCNDNIIVVLCGHVGGLFACTSDTNDFGHEVMQIQHNIQSPDYRYDNWLMMWEFPVESDSANVSIINTKTGLLYEGKDVLCRFRYRTSSTF